ncbi:MAG: hypothetical protein LC808_29335, partial [Actinobacteria bacterium]|nr:hypothetical protein [Actinomycetota bacterium]
MRIFGEGATTTKYTHADFDGMSWHDCCIHGFELLTGDPDRGDWTNDLALDIDFIVQWACGADGGARFHVAPATLTFHNVTDLQIRIAWADSDYRIAIHPASIGRIEREEVIDHGLRLDRSYYAWVVRLNWPDGGVIRFGAVGFTQQLRAEPVEMASQHLPSAHRR